MLVSRGGRLPWARTYASEAVNSGMSIAAAVSQSWMVWPLLVVVYGILGVVSYGIGWVGNGMGVGVKGEKRGGEYVPIVGFVEVVFVDYERPECFSMTGLWVTTASSGGVGVVKNTVENPLE